MATILCVLYDDPVDGDVWFPQPAPKDHPWRTIGSEEAVK
jgi:hypothetical protein